MAFNASEKIPGAFLQAKISTSSTMQKSDLVMDSQGITVSLLMDILPVMHHLPMPVMVLMMC